MQVGSDIKHKGDQFCSVNVRKLRIELHNPALPIDWDPDRVSQACERSRTNGPALSG